MSKPKVLLSVLCGRERDLWIAPPLFSTLLHLRDEQFELVIETAYDKKPYEHARNHCIAKARDFGYSHAVMVDNDMILPHNFHDILHESIVAKKAVVGLKAGALCDGRLTMLSCHDKGVVDGNFRRTGVVGGGVLIIGADVWRTIPTGPWFRWLVEGELSSRKIGEDYFFCELVQEHGLEVWTHKQAAGHLKTMDLTQMCQTLGLER